MYFLWKRTPHGSIRVSSDGFSNFVNNVLSGKSRCRGLSLTEGENAAITLVLSSNNDAAERCKIEESITGIIAPLGLKARVIWTDKGTPGAELYEMLSSVYQSPWTWMLVVALVVLKFMAGWKGLFWTIFWGTAAWFVSKVVISAIMKKRMGFTQPLARR